MDGWGKAPVVSRAGNNGYFLFVDKATRFKRLYPYKRRSDYEECERLFIEETHSEGYMVLALRSDGVVA